MRKLWVVAIVLLLSTVTAPLAPAAAGPTPTASRYIAGQFIITLRDSADARSVAAEYRRGGADIDFVYTEALNGFAAKMSDSQVSQARRDGRVLRIEQDQVVTADTTQLEATWGLDRSDQRALPLDQKYTHNATGTDVSAYIIDTGIRATHADLKGRVSGGYTAIADGKGTNDCNGHGTHVAGTVGGTTYGVAKGVKLVPVRVLDCKGSGTWSGVIAGLDWVTTDHAAGTPAVANMSLGGGASSSLDAAVEAAIGDGITMAVAAGNGNRAGIAQDACNYSPARVPAAITIGATTKSDAKASWSNYGSCVDWFAPGVGITSAWYTGDTDTNTISGTSMATPHVAGAAALYLQGAPSASPLTVTDALYAMTTKGIVTSSKTANNHLLYTLAIGAGGSTTNAAPVANDDTATAASGTTITVEVLSNDSDADADLLTIDSHSVASGGSVTCGLTDCSYSAPEVTSQTTYTFTYVATDGTALSNEATVTITVEPSTSEPPGTAISLSATAYKVKGVQHADLTWSGATSTNVDVYRDGGTVATTANDGAYTDSIGKKGGGSYTYKVCEADSTTCSNKVTVTF